MQKPAVKMMFTLLVVGVILLKGMELHKHRHGHQDCSETDPMHEINYSQKTDQIQEGDSVQEINPMEEDRYC